MEIAQLLGYDNYAEYTEETHGRNQHLLYTLLNQLLDAYTPTARKEYEAAQELAPQKSRETI